jgi:hypothetical protein
MELRHLKEIDPRLSDLDDRPLFIALKQLGWDGLVTNNYKMLQVPDEIAAIIGTKATVVAIKGTGHDPLRALGALLLELPGLPDRVKRNDSNVFLLHYQNREPDRAWKYLQVLATRRRADLSDLYAEVKVTDLELGTPVLG